MDSLHPAPTLGTLVPEIPCISFCYGWEVPVLQVKPGGVFEWAEDAAQRLEDDAPWQGPYGPLMRAILQRLWDGEPRT